MRNYGDMGPQGGCRRKYVISHIKSAPLVVSQAHITCTMGIHMYYIHVHVYTGNCRKENFETGYFRISLAGIASKLHRNMDLIGESTTYPESLECKPKLEMCWGKQNYIFTVLRLLRFLYLCAL